MRQKLILLIVASCAPILGCASSTSSSYTENDSTVTINKIIVRLPGKVSTPDDDLFKTITDGRQIIEIVRFTDMQLSKPGWGLEKLDSPAPFFICFFYEEDKYKRGFGIGSNFFTTTDNGYSVRYVTTEERNELLKILDITEEEYLRLSQELYEPRPWKKKP